MGHFTLSHKNAPLATQGKYAEAEPLYKRSHAIREKALGSEHPDVAESLNNQARLLYRQVWNSAVVLMFPRSAFRGRVHILSLLVENLQNAFIAQGKYDEAEPLYERTQRIFEKFLGEDHPNVAKLLKNRAELLKALVSLHWRRRVPVWLPPREFPQGYFFYGGRLAQRLQELLRMRCQ